MFRWSDHNFPDDFIPWLTIAERIGRELSIAHSQLTPLDERRTILLAQGLSGLSRYFPDRDPVFGPPPPEDESFDLRVERRKLESLEKLAVKLQELLRPNTITHNVLEATFAAQPDPSSFFDDPEVYVNWPEASYVDNAAFDQWVLGLTELQRSITAAIQLLEARVSVMPDSTEKEPTITTIRAELIPALFEAVYEGAAKGGTHGGRGLVGPLYSFQVAVLSRISDLKTTPGSMRQARHRNP